MPIGRNMETTCCASIRSARPASRKSELCPACQQPGKLVDIVTPKSLLLPDAMKQLNPDSSFLFCATKDCSVVYFNEQQSFVTSDVSVRVFQKDEGPEVLACYCFGFSREMILAEKAAKSTVIEEITRYVHEKKCACELRNPQGTCCLGNLRQVISLEAGHVDAGHR